MRISRAAAVACAGLLAAALAACTTSQPAASTASGASTGAGGEAAAATPAAGSVPEALAANAPSHAQADDAAYDAASAVRITLDGSSAAAGGSNVSIAGSRVTVTAPGTYLVSGTLGDGQLLVNSPGEGTVRIVLDDVEHHVVDVRAVRRARGRRGGRRARRRIEQHARRCADVHLSRGRRRAQRRAVLRGRPHDRRHRRADGDRERQRRHREQGRPGHAVRQRSRCGPRTTGSAARTTSSSTVATVTVTAGGDGVKADNAEEADRGLCRAARGHARGDQRRDGFDAATDVIVGAGATHGRCGRRRRHGRSPDASAKGVKGAVERRGRRRHDHRRLGRRRACTRTRL